MSGGPRAQGEPMAWVVSLRDKILTGKQRWAAAFCVGLSERLADQQYDNLDGATVQGVLEEFKGFPDAKQFRLLEAQGGAVLLDIDKLVASLGALPDVSFEERSIRVPVLLRRRGEGVAAAGGGQLRADAGRGGQVATAVYQRVAGGRRN